MLTGAERQSVQVVRMSLPIKIKKLFWNIFSLSYQLESKIYIFDRYGKLLKEIRPQSRGWDGTYNGVLMPSSDYWFTVNYTDPKSNTVKEYRAHFALKR